MMILKGTLKCFIQMSLFCDKERKRKKSLFNSKVIKTNIQIIKYVFNVQLYMYRMYLVGD